MTLANNRGRTQSANLTDWRKYFELVVAEIDLLGRCSTKSGDRRLDAQRFEVNFRAKRPRPDEPSYGWLACLRMSRCYMNMAPQTGQCHLNDSAKGSRDTNPKDS